MAVARYKIRTYDAHDKRSIKIHKLIGPFYLDDKGGITPTVNTARYIDLLETKSGKHSVVHSDKDQKVSFNGWSFR